LNLASWGFHLSQAEIANKPDSAVYQANYAVVLREGKAYTNNEVTLSYTNPAWKSAREQGTAAPIILQCTCPEWKKAKECTHGPAVLMRMISEATAARVSRASERKAAVGLAGSRSRECGTQTERNSSATQKDASAT
jgi:hypothetical protein